MIIRYIQSIKRSVIHLERLECKKRDFSLLKPFANTLFMHLSPEKTSSESKGVAPQIQRLKKLDS